MATKKINLKFSVNAINTKSAILAKKKALPKLKAILANPYKPKFETLIDNELSQFKELISSAVKSSKTSGRLFAKQNNIQLGLGSSLRVIGNKKASCVIISHSIKPKFIIDQIGCFTKQKNSTVPVFIVEDWDTISAKLFDVKALVVVFPLNVSGELGKWISKRTLATKDIQKLPEDKELNAPFFPLETSNTVNLNSMYLTKPSNGERSFVPDVVIKSNPIPTHQSKDWTGDFISFSNKNENMEEKMDMDEVDEEFTRKQDKALEAFQRIAKSIQKVDNEPKTITKAAKKITPKPSMHKKTENTVSEEWENDTSYISLQVHKIQPNPNRKSKNKRKNKNKKKELKLNKK